MKRLTLEHHALLLCLIAVLIAPIAFYFFYPSDSHGVLVSTEGDWHLNYPHTCDEWLALTQGHGPTINGVAVSWTCTNEPQGVRIQTIGVR